MTLLCDHVICLKVATLFIVQVFLGKVSLNSVVVSSFCNHASHTVSFVGVVGVSVFNKIKFQLA
jgi:hypothetical protein